MKKYGGRVFFLDRDNINTDEIIPAKYLTEIEREPLKAHLLEDLKMEGFDPSKIKWSDYGVVISRSNFGSGSSREMAVWAFAVNGINVIIASNFARIFRENAFNDGVLAIELAPKIIDDIFMEFRAAKDFSLDVDLDKLQLFLKTKDTTRELPFHLTPFQRDVIRSGSWVELAAKKY